MKDSFVFGVIMAFASVIVATFLVSHSDYQRKLNAAESVDSSTIESGDMLVSSESETVKYPGTSFEYCNPINVGGSGLIYDEFTHIVYYRSQGAYSTSYIPYYSPHGYLYSFDPDSGAMTEVIPQYYTAE